MTVLTQRMREELVRRNYAQTTIRTYLMAIEEFRRHAEKRLDHLGPDDIRRCQCAVLEEQKLAVGTVALRVSALRFFCRIQRIPSGPYGCRRFSRQKR